MLNKQEKSKALRDNVRQFYNTVCEPFSDTRENWWDDLNFVRQFWKPGEKLLDFGCGNGRLIDFLKIDPADYQGIDIAENMLWTARRKHPSHQFEFIADEAVTPFGRETFDSVFAIAVLHHLQPSMVAAAFKGIKHILKPKGHLVMTAWYLWDKKHLKFLIQEWVRGNWGLNASLPFVHGAYTSWRPCYWWTAGYLADAVRDAGFNVTEARVTKDARGYKRNIVVVAQKP